MHLKRLGFTLVIGVAVVFVLAGLIMTTKTPVESPSYVPMILREKAAILQVSVSNTKPYVLSVDVKSLCNENLNFLHAIIRDVNRNVVSLS